MQQAFQRGKATEKNRGREGGRRKREREDRGERICRNIEIKYILYFIKSEYGWHQVTSGIKQELKLYAFRFQEQLHSCILVWAQANCLSWIFCNLDHPKYFHIYSCLSAELFIVFHMHIKRNKPDFEQWKDLA